MHGLDVFVFLGGGDVALFARGGGDDGQPDYSLGSPFFLEVFHAAGKVVLLVVGAAFIGPLEDYVFASVLREGVFASVGVLAFEVRCGVAGDYGEGWDGGKGQGES